MARRRTKRVLRPRAPSRVRKKRTKTKKPRGHQHPELLDWESVLKRAGVVASPARVAHTYLELAVLVRALEGLAGAARLDSAPHRSSLWAGLFDLRENLLNGALEDLRALAA